VGIRPHKRADEAEHAVIRSREKLMISRANARAYKREREKERENGRFSLNTIKCDPRFIKLG